MTAIARAAAFAVAALLAASLAPARPAAAAPVPLEVCAEDRDWLRPSEDEMARTVWRDNRYREPDGRPIAQALAYHRAHFVVFAVVTGSGVAHALDMTGLMPTRPHGLCEARTDAGLRAGRTLVVWALGYHPTASDLAGATVTVTVEPNATPAHGYAAVEVPRPPTARWTARFVLPDGREVGRVLAGSGVALADEPGPGTAGRLPSAGGVPGGAIMPTAALGAALAGLGVALRAARRRSWSATDRRLGRRPLRGRLALASTRPAWSGAADPGCRRSGAGLHHAAEHRSHRGGLRWNRCHGDCRDRLRLRPQCRRRVGPLPAYSFWAASTPVRRRCGGPRPGRRG